MISIKRTVKWLFIFFIFGNSAFSQNSLNSKFEKIVFGCHTKDLTDFENFVKRAKQSGATHINLSNEDLPASRWEYDVKEDPYPSWVITNMGLLKIATPEILKPYMPQDYAESVIKILEERCKILRKYGLKASLTTFEPQMLPEKVYTDHPLWRGPRVDHPSRSKVARFAPDIDNPEVLKLYSESLTILLKRCPEIDILSLRTNDSGTGLSWSGGLYSGASGNTFSKNRRMDERLFGFFSGLQDAAQKSGNNLDIDIYNTKEEYPEIIAAKLTKGMAIENQEGPDGRSFKFQVGYVLEYRQSLCPVVGIPDPVQFLDELEEANKSTAQRLFVLIGDRFNKELYFKIYDKFNPNPTSDVLSHLTFLKNLATENIGKKDSEALLKMWLALSESRKTLSLGNQGGTVFYIGSLMERWLTRPFVPFPEELSPSDKDYFRKFQFMGYMGKQADDLANLQANRIYSGWSGKYFMSVLMQSVRVSIDQARIKIAGILKSDLSTDQKNEFNLLDLRLRALTLMCNNAENATSYQAQLDKGKARAVKCEPEPAPDADFPSGLDRNMILETARNEIDNTAMILQLLESTNEEIFDLAPTKELEDIRRLGPDFKNQLKHKLRIMNEHWLDYNRIYTAPNL
jgi:hypothetical protein